MRKKTKINENLTLLPDAPGVYLMYNVDAQVIYVGKAKNLKKRVKSYFNKNHDSPKLVIMVPQIERFEFIITDSEVEALILESQLIKKYKPKYNVLLKDDKRYPWFLITDEDYPRIIITRKTDIPGEKGRYFGPYTDGRAMYATLEVIKKIFPLKQCKTPRFKDRPCMYYQIGKCLAPCQGLVSPNAYKDMTRQVGLFLSGKQNELIEEIKNQMELAAEHQEFEKAAKYRDSYFDIMKSVARQKVISDNTTLNQDIIVYKNDDLLMAITLLKVREGRLIAKESFDIKLERIHEPYEAFMTFVQEHYRMINKAEMPNEMLFDECLTEDDRELLQDWLKIKILTPKLQIKQELVEMARKNADSDFEVFKLAEMVSLQNDWNEVGSFIKEKLGLPTFPARIDCFDISHIQGTNAVASMVVFVNGKPDKSEYRKYKIKTLPDGQTDDFASMKEVIRRRYQRFQLPDLIIVDGGKGQLSSAIEALEEAGVYDAPIVSLAKRFEEVFVPSKFDPIDISGNQNALFLFQQVRDEAHRFAINYHRKLREKNAIRSILDNVPGLDISHKKLLLEHFGDIKGILSANKSELARLLGKYRGYKLYKALHES